LKLNRHALVEALDREFSEVTNFTIGPRAVLTIVLAGTSLGLSAGIVGWLLRGGGLLSALLSSMPLWRGFDPLPVVMRPRRRQQAEHTPTDVDRLFDAAAADRPAARLELGRGYADLRGIRPGQSPNINISGVH
jgi:hypothetical protein